MFLHSIGDEMGSWSHSDEGKHSTPRPVLWIVARGRRRFLVQSMLAGTIILWILFSGLFMARGYFHGLDVVYVTFLETVLLLSVFPFALAIAYYQWKKFHKMASMGISSVADRDTTRGRNEGATGGQPES